MEHLSFHWDSLIWQVLNFKPAHQRSRNTFLERVSRTLVHSILVGLADTPVKGLLDSSIPSIASCFLAQFPRIKMDSYLEDFAAIPMRCLSQAAVACDSSANLLHSALHSHIHPVTTESQSWGEHYFFQVCSFLKYTPSTLHMLFQDSLGFSLSVLSSYSLFTIY